MSLILSPVSNSCRMWYFGRKNLKKATMKVANFKKGTGLDIPADVFAEGFVVHKPAELLGEEDAEFFAVVM